MRASERPAASGTTGSPRTQPDGSAHGIPPRLWTGYSGDDVRAMLRAEVGNRGDQKDLAGRIGISPSWLSDILAGHRAPAGKVLEYLKLKRHAVRIYTLPEMQP